MGECGAGTPVDWWAVGILLYELLSGNTPFGSSETVENVNDVISHKILYTSPPILPNLDDKTADFIFRLLEKNPHKRLGKIIHIKYECADIYKKFLK